MSEFTTIQIRKKQVEQLEKLKRYPKEPIREVVERLLQEKFIPVEANIHVHKWRKHQTGETVCKKCGAIGAWDEEQKDWIEAFQLDAHTT